MHTISENGSGRRINVEDAKIKTAAVEIKSLTVSGKQVTLAVFRQLQEESLFDMDGCDMTFEGIPWGRVNYHFDKCGIDPETGKHYTHLHIVWQKGNELRRTLVEHPFYWLNYFKGYSDMYRLYEQRYEELQALDQLFIAV